MAVQRRPAQTDQTGPVRLLVSAPHPGSSTEPPRSDTASGPWALLRAILSDNGLHPHERLVLLSLLQHADSDGSNAAPALERLASCTGLSESSARRARESLRSRFSLIEVRQPATNRRPATYGVDLAAVLDLYAGPSRGGAVTPPGVSEGHPNEPRGVSVEPLGVSEGHPKTPRGVSVTPLGVSEGHPTVPYTVPSTKSLQKKKTLGSATRDSSCASHGEVVDQFDAFYQAYPRKVAKEAARKAFAKLNPGQELLADMLAALERQKRSRQWAEGGGKFVPHPATWLNGRRWEDAPDDPPAKSTGPAWLPRKPVEGTRCPFCDGPKEPGSMSCERCALSGIAAEYGEYLRDALTRERGPDGTSPPTGKGPEQIPMEDGP